MITVEKQEHIDAIKAEAEIFTQSWKRIAHSAQQINALNGFWDGERNKGEMIALMHSELSEALEALRKDANDDKIPQYLGEEAELADAAIRVMDYDAGFSLRIAEAIIDKLVFNAGREPKHGKKF